jgi:hypothetical protein
MEGQLMAVSFPASPTVGQIHIHNTFMWRWDGTSWESIGETDVAGRLAGGPTRPTSPIQGQVFFNNKTRTMEIYDGSEWRRVSQENRQYLYRQVIVKSFVMGGYKDTSPWRNVNSMNHQTDLMVNLGDLLHTASSYSSGGCGKVNGYTWNANSAWSTASTTISGINMFTETGFASGTTATMLYSRNDCGTVFKEQDYAYLVGGGTSNIDVYNFNSDTFFGAQSLTTATTGGTRQAGMASHSGETHGYVWHATAGYQITFAANQVATVATDIARSSSSQQKGISSKHGIGYAGNEGTYNGGYNLRKTQYSTGLNIGTVPKPIGNCGEENFDMGQNHQNCLGNYDGLQNNRGWKFSYITETGFEYGAGSVRTGPPGGSSGHGVWRG